MFCVRFGLALLNRSREAVEYTAYLSVTIHNSIIYLFDINSRKLDGHYRSWIEYLNERF